MDDDLQKWCTGCKETHPLSAFGSDRSRPDGFAASCRAARKRRYDATYVSRGDRVNPLTGRPGPAPKPPRDGDREQARQRINVEVRTGRRANPNDLPCADCGHRDADRRHEYDHHLGYAAEHHLDVEPVCTTCHHARAIARGEQADPKLRPRDRGRFRNGDTSNG